VYRRATPWDDLVEVPHGYHIAGDEVRVSCLADGQLFYDTDSGNESSIWYRIASGFYLPSTNVDLPGNPRVPVC